MGVGTHFSFFPPWFHRPTDRPNPNPSQHTHGETHETQRLVLCGRTLQVAATQAPTDKLRFSSIPTSWGVEALGRSLEAQGCDAIYDIEVRRSVSPSARWSGLVWSLVCGSSLTQFVRFVASLFLQSVGALIWCLSGDSSTRSPHHILPPYSHHPSHTRSCPRRRRARGRRARRRRTPTPTRVTASWSTTTTPRRRRRTG